MRAQIRAALIHMGASIFVHSALFLLLVVGGGKGRQSK